MNMVSLAGGLMAVLGSVVLAWKGAEVFGAFQVLVWWPGQPAPSSLDAFLPTLLGTVALAAGIDLAGLGFWNRNKARAATAIGKTTITCSGFLFIAAGLVIAWSATGAIRAFQVLMASETAPGRDELAELSSQLVGQASFGFGILVVAALLLLPAALIEGRKRRAQAKQPFVGLSCIIMLICTVPIAAFSAFAWHLAGDLDASVSGSGFPRPSELASPLSGIWVSLLVWGGSLVPLGLSQAVLGLCLSTRTD